MVSTIQTNALQSKNSEHLRKSTKVMNLEDLKTKIDNYLYHYDQLPHQGKSFANFMIQKLI